MFIQPLRPANAAAGDGEKRYDVVLRFTIAAHHDSSGGIA